MLDEPDALHVRQEVEGGTDLSPGRFSGRLDGVVRIQRGGAPFLLREPERSRSVVPLLVGGHWLLLHVESREGLRPRRPAVRARLTASRPASVPLYPVWSRCAPPGARRIAVRRNLRGLANHRPLDAKLLILRFIDSSGDPWPPNLMYRRAPPHFRHHSYAVHGSSIRRERGTLRAFWTKPWSGPISKQLAGLMARPTWPMQGDDADGRVADRRETPSSRGRKTGRKGTFLGVAAE